MPTKNVPIDADLIKDCQTRKPRWLSTTAFINQMVYDGLEGVAEHVILKVPSGTETHKKEEKKENKSEGTLSNTNRVSNSINKEKEIFKKVKFKFSKELIPFELEQHSEKIEEFWKVKTGRKSEQAFNLLISNLIAIKKKYTDQTLTDQLDLAIAGGPKGPWSNVTLKNYETFSKQNSWSPEPTPNHPASRVFRNGKFEDQ